MLFFKEKIYKSGHSIFSPPPKKCSLNIKPIKIQMNLNITDMGVKW